MKIKIWANIFVNRKKYVGNMKKLKNKEMYQKAIVS